MSEKKKNLLRVGIDINEPGEGASGGGMNVLTFTYNDGLEGGTYVADVTPDEFLSNIYTYTHIGVVEEGEPYIQWAVSYAVGSADTSPVLYSTPIIQHGILSDALSMTWGIASVASNVVVFTESGANVSIIDS